MADITFKGSPIHTVGELPQTGSALPDFSLTDGGLAERSLADFEGKRKVISIVPSLDTGVCAATTRVFNEKIGELADTVVLTISADLPFAQKRFCEAEGLDHVVCLSTFRAPAFGAGYGVRIEDGPLAGLLSRAILVADAANRILYTEQVPEIAQEPDYDSVMKALGT